MHWGGLSAVGHDAEGIAKTDDCYGSCASCQGGKANGRYRKDKFSLTNKAFKSIHMVAYALVKYCRMYLVFTRSPFWSFSQFAS